MDLGRLVRNRHWVRSISEPASQVIFALLRVRKRVLPVCRGGQGFGRLRMNDEFHATRFGRLHVRAAGSGAPLILLHSNGGSAYEYEHVHDELARRYRVIAWDMPGQG